MNASAAIVGQAPGRLDFLGGVADYSGALVLQTPTRCTTRVTLEPLAEDTVECRAVGLAVQRAPLAPLRQTMNAGADWAELRAILDELGAPHWTRYLLGCLLVFARAKNWMPGAGIRFSVESAVPQSLGVSSSAALEIATLRALAAFADKTFAGNEIAHLGQRAENHLVSAPCGLMDQLASAFGEPGKLLPILCRPDELRAPVALPQGACVVGWPSAVKHAVSGSPYGTARTASFMGKKILESSLIVDGSDDRSGFRYTSEIPLVLLKNFFGDKNGILRGDFFLQTYGNVDDPLSHIEPHRDYPVRAATEFAIEENERCQMAESLLANCPSANRREVLPRIGALMSASHHAYGRMGLGAPETDRMIEAIQRLGVERGFYGARISGGGSGGTVVVLCEHDSLEALAELGRKVPGASPRLIF